MRTRLILLLLAVALMSVSLWWSQRRTGPVKVSGFIEADEIRVGSRVGGRVARVLVVEGQTVRVGELLLQLEPFDLVDRRAEAAARVEKLTNGPRPQEIGAAEARLQLARSQRELAATTLKRVQESFQRSAASPDELDNALESDKSAQAQVEVRLQELDELKAGTRTEEIAEARARLDAIEKQIGELSVKSPVNGVVEAVELQPGDLVPANAPVLSLLDNSRLWVRAYVPEDRMNLQAGQVLEITVDSMPARRFKGRIGFIARHAEFTPNNVQTPDERSKQVFRIKVDLEEGLDVLRPGMSADVWLSN